MKRVYWLLIVILLATSCLGCRQESTTTAMHALLEGKLTMPPPLNPITKHPVRVYLERNSWTEQLSRLAIDCLKQSPTPLWQLEEEQAAQGGTIEQWFLRWIRSYPYLTEDPDEADVIFLDATLTLAAQLYNLQRFNQRFHAGSCKLLVGLTRKHSFNEMAVQRRRVFCDNHNKMVLFDAFWRHLWPELLDIYRFASFSNRFTGNNSDNQFISVPSTSNAELVISFLQRDCRVNHTKSFDLFFSGAARSRKGGQLRQMLTTIDWQQEFPGSIVSISPGQPFDRLLPEKAIVYSREYANHILQSRFCLIVAGDSANCRRLFEAVLSGCIPILYSDWWDWLPFNWLPDLWTPSTLLQINTSLDTPETFLPRLHDIISSITPQQMAHMQASLRRILPDILWGIGSPDASPPLFGRAPHHFLTEAARRVREAPLPKEFRLKFCQ